MSKNEKKYRALKWSLAIWIVLDILILCFLPEDARFFLGISPSIIFVSVLTIESMYDN